MLNPDDWEWEQTGGWAYEADSFWFRLRYRVKRFLGKVWRALGGR